MANKKEDLPAMPFYIGDWKKDPAVSVLTREEKYIWIEIMMLMWESKERGYLTINGKPYTEPMLSKSLNLDNQRLTECLTYFESLDLFSRRESDGAIYSRFQVKLVDIQNKRKTAGSKGGNPNLINQNLNKNKASGYPNAENENENETENINEIKINPEINDLETEEKNISGYYEKIIPKKLLSSREFVEAWKNWLGFNVERGTDILPSVAKEQLNWLGQFSSESAAKLVITAHANQWKGVIYADGRNGEDNKKSHGRVGITEDEFINSVNQVLNNPNPTGGE